MNSIIEGFKLHIVCFMSGLGQIMNAKKDKVSFLYVLFL